jgi:hypothetical protein
MNITVEQIDNKITEIMKEANETDAGLLISFLGGIDKADLLSMVNQQVSLMTSEIAEQMSQEVGAPVLAVAPKAHEIALAHLASFMFVAGYAMRGDEFAVADNLTDDTIEAAISQILGGSND